MEIQAGSSVSTISLASLVRATNGQGKVSFPVNPHDLAYANFKNIKTVPSSSVSGSYSVSRLRAVDNLIEQLSRMNGNQKIETPKQDDLSPDKLDTLVSKLATEVHTKLDSNPVYRAQVKSTGLLFNMLI